MEMLEWVKDNSQTENTYIIEVTADETIEPISRLPADIILRGSGGVRTIRTNITINFGVTLVLGDNIILRGDGDGGSVVTVVLGTLIMEEGSRITGGGNSGVYIRATTGYATFTMNGGEISGNTAAAGYGGGLYNRGEVRITTGTIYGIYGYGIEAASNLSNTAARGAALASNNANIKYGSGRTWNDIPMNNIDPFFFFTDITIRVVNGAL